MKKGSIQMKESQEDSYQTYLIRMWDVWKNKQKSNEISISPGIPIQFDHHSDLIEYRASWTGNSSGNTWNQFYKKWIFF